MLRGIGKGKEMMRSGVVKKGLEENLERRESGKLCGTFSVM